ncbi:hypothetical protein Tco_0968937 [Tanacetum coccineum]
MSTPKFVKTHNLVAFLEKLEESNGFKGIIDFLNASSIKYVLMVNPTVYESCIKQFWATAKAKTVNGECQTQALVDKKKVIITEKSVRSDLMLEDAEGIECLPNDVVFEQLALMGAKTTAWNEFSSTMASAIICLATNQKFNFFKYIFDHMMMNFEGGVKFLMYLRFVQVFLDKQVEGMSKHKGIYVTPSHTKKIFANMKREGKGFFGRNTPLFQTMMVQALEDMGEDSAAPTDSYSTPIITQPLSSKPQKKKSRRKQRKDSGPTVPIPDEATNEEPISTPSCDPPQSDEDRLQLTELMILCTKLQKQVLDLEEAKTAQAKEIASLKKRVKQLEKRKKSRTSGLKRLRKVGLASRVESFNDVSLDSRKDAEVALIDKTQEGYDEEMLFDIQDDLQGKEVVAEKKVAEKDVSAADPVTTAGEVVTTASATTTEQASAFTPIVFSSQLPQAKDKGEAKIVEPKKPLKKKDQIALDEELELILHAEEQAKLERTQKERVAQVEASREAIIEELDSIQAMIETDEQLARAAEQRSKPPTKNQIRNRMCTYLKNMGGYKHNQLKGRSYEEIQKLFDKAYKQVNSFVPMDSESISLKMGSKKEGVFRGGPKGYSVSIPKTVKKQESKSSCCFRSLSESRRFWKSRIRKKDIVNLIYFRGLCAIFYRSFFSD